MVAEKQVKTSDASDIEHAQEAKRKAELIRRFADQFTNASTEITPKWQRAIATYKRVKAEKTSE